MLAPLPPCDRLAADFRRLGTGLVITARHFLQLEKPAEAGTLPWVCGVMKCRATDAAPAAEALALTLLCRAWVCAASHFRPLQQKVYAQPIIAFTPVKGTVANFAQMYLTQRSLIQAPMPANVGLMTLSSRGSACPLPAHSCAAAPLYGAHF